MMELLFVIHLEVKTLN